MTTEDKLELYEKLCEAIYSGVLEVKFSDREIKYRSLKDMKETKKDLEIELKLRKKISSTINPAFNKGL